MNISKTKIIAALLILAVLAFAFFWGGNGRQSTSETPTTVTDETLTIQDTPDTLVPDSQPIQPPEESATETQKEEEASPSESVPQPATETMPEIETSIPQPPEPTPEPEATDIPAESTLTATVRDKYLTDALPEGVPPPVEPEDVIVGDTAYTCTLSIRCDTVLDNLSKLDQNKVELIPEDGILLAPVTVTFYEGESVFEVLRREMKARKIHMEFVTTPLYNSAYIEGIGNLYEYDCGQLSGWIYMVNGRFPNYGCSRYQPEEGDVIVWVYTCDLGQDVGDDWMAGE